MHLVADWANRVIVLEQGRVAADVEPRELFAQPELLARVRLVPPQVAELGLALGLEQPPLNVVELLECLQVRERVSC